MTLYLQAGFLYKEIQNPMDKPEFLSRQYHHQPRFWLILFLVMALLLLVRFCTNPISKHPKKTDKPVIVAIASKNNVPIYINALGTVNPLYTVTVKSQINGIMQTVNFVEGQDVKAGDLLAQIDPRPYEAQLIEYQGQLARDQALLANAQIDLARYKTLLAQNSTSQQTYETQKWLVAQYEGTVKLDQGLMDTTLVNLIYCKIISPIDGRIGLRLVDPGNFVQTSDTTGIALVTTLSPINVIFPIAEDYIPQVLAQLNATTPLMVEAYDRQQKHVLATGKLLTIDNQINTATGTVNMKAQFLNAEKSLFSNQFVNIKLLVETLNNVTLVPTSAIQYRDKDHFVYLVKKNKKVVQQPVTVGVTTGDNTVITKGVAPGNVVITEGAENLLSDDKVVITNAKALNIKDAKP